MNNNGIPFGPVYSLVPDKYFYPEDMPPWAGKGKKKMDQLEVDKTKKPIVVAKKKSNTK